MNVNTNILFVEQLQKNMLITNYLYFTYKKTEVQGNNLCKITQITKW